MTATVTTSQGPQVMVLGVGDGLLALCARTDFTSDDVPKAIVDLGGDRVDRDGLRTSPAR